MANVQIISNQIHRNLRCNNEYIAEYGYDAGAIMVFPSEISEVQRLYPILFRKDAETGLLFPNAMLGFRLNENLFLDKGKWNASYVPLIAAKGPFMVTFQANDNGESIPVVCADLDDKRFGEGTGERLFNDEGVMTPYFSAVSSRLAQLENGLHEMRMMVQSFLDFDLIEPVTLDIQFKNGEKINFSGAYTLAEEKLNELSSDKLQRLNELRFLGLAHMISSSLSNVKKLIEIKNRDL